MITGAAVIAAAPQPDGMQDEADPLLAQELAALQAMSDEQVARELDQHKT
jgi:hypothetical protein